MKITKKKIIISIVAILTLIGSLNFESGTWPFHIKKGGTSYAINFCVVTDYLPGSTHNGINVSIWTNHYTDSRINGVNISLFNVFTQPNKPFEYGQNTSIINGLEIGLINIGTNMKVADLLTSSSEREVKGVQIGLFNHAILKGVQIGILNAHDSNKSEKNKSTIGINIGSGKE